MTTAQLQLPFNPVEMIPQKPKDKSQEKSLSFNASALGKKIVVRELLDREQDFEILHMAQMFAEDVDLDESVDVDTVLLSCIKVRLDIDRKNVNCFIAYEHNKPIGFLVGVASPAFHRKGIVAEQKLCYVIPNRRGSFAALRLVQAFERWARLQGSTQIFTGTANKRYAEKTSKFFEQIGYARVGSLHVKEI